MWTIFSQNGAEAGQEQVPIRFFGDLKNIYRMSELDAEKTDEMAKVLNVWYCKGEIPRDRQTIEDEWNKAPVRHYTVNIHDDGFYLFKTLLRYHL